MYRYLLSLCIVLMSMFANGQNYNVVDLGVLPGGSISFGQAIDKSGQVAGFGDNGTRTHALLFSNGEVTDLGVLGQDYLSQASGINPSGLVVGTSFGSTTSNAFLYSGGTMQSLAPTLFSAYFSEALAINPSGQITGVAHFPDVTFSQAFVITNGVVTRLGGLPGGNFSSGFGINQSGQVTGCAIGTAPYQHAFLYDGTMHDLGTLGHGEAELSQGTGISDDGKVVGFSSVNNLTGTHAAMFSNGAVTDLGVLGSSSVAIAINPSGTQIVGNGDVSDTNHALLFHFNGTPQDLNTLIPTNSGWVLVSADGVNDAGQIAGTGVINGATHAFRLDPIPYKAFIQQPINPDGSSIFSGSKGVVPVKFILTQNNTPTCTLPAATIALTRTAGGTVGTVDESTYVANADSGSNFRIDPTACQYVYNLAAKSLGVGVYRVDIAINGSIIGSGVFALK